MRVLLAAALVLALCGSSARALRVPDAPRCPVFPASNAWNERVDSLPVAAGSEQMVASIGLGSPVHADFGSGLYEGRPIGIPFDVVTRKTPRSRVSFQYAGESDKGPYPIPSTVQIEGGRAADGDRHAILIDRDACRLYELYALYPKSRGGWRAGSGAIFDLRSNALRPAGWTSADAAGLPIFAGLARYDEAHRGVIDHALRFTARKTRRAYIYPARHYASDSNDPSLPPMGLRVRLKGSFDVGGFPPQARIVLTALKRYGMILADNGAPWYISGAPSPGWSNDDLHTLGRLHGSDFEVVDTSSLPHPGGEVRGAFDVKRGRHAKLAAHEDWRRSRSAKRSRPRWDDRTAAPARVAGGRRLAARLARARESRAGRSAAAGRPEPCAPPGRRPPRPSAARSRCTTRRAA